VFLLGIWVVLPIRENLATHTAQER